MRFLPHDTAETTWVYPHQHQQHTQRNHWIQNQKYIADSKGMVYTSQPKDVRAPTIRTIGQWTIGTMTQQKRLSPEQVGPRVMVSLMAHSQVHISSWQLRCKICQRRTHTPSQTNLQRKLQSHTWMGRMMIHWHHLRLGLQAQVSPFIHAWIHHKGAQTIQTQTTHKTTSTIP